MSAQPIQTLLKDLRFAARTLRKSPGFAAISLITLALGIGATTAMFSVVNQTLLRPLPFKDPSRLVLLKELIPRIDTEPGWIPAPDVLAFQSQTRSFDGVGGYVDAQMDLDQGSSPVRITVARMSWQTFPVLGIAPMLGRTFSEAEDRPGSQVAVLSYDSWQRRFGGVADIIGREINLDRKSFSIIGVMPPGFMLPLESAYPTPVELWTPMGFTDAERTAYASLFMYGAVARLKPSVTVAQAQADAASVMPGIIDRFPPNLKGQVIPEAAVVPFQEDTYRTLRAPLSILFLAVVFVLMIAIANVAGLMLVRGAGRQKELALRIALGASGARIIGQLLTESLLLSLLGGVAGVLTAGVGARLLIAQAPATLQRLGAPVVDPRVLIFALLVSVVSGLLFGVAPAVFALRTNLTGSLKEGGRSGGYGRQHHRLRFTFVIVQMAMAMILLVGSGLLIRSFQQVIAIKGGFQPEHVTIASVFLPKSDYPQTERVQSFLNDLLARMRQIPGVQTAAISTAAPLKTSWRRIVTPEGYQPPPGEALNPTSYTVVQGDYFRALGIPLISGRVFSPEETVNGSRSVIISQSFARRYFAGKDPIGLRLKFVVQHLPTSWLTVVGVVGDATELALDDQIGPETYVPFTAEEIPNLQRVGGVQAFLSVKSSINSGGIGEALQAAVWGLDRQLPVTEITTMNQVMDQSTAPRRFTMLLVVAFGSAALLLASIGLYGVIAYSVTERTHEVGIRVALGATRRDIQKMVLGWGLSLAVIGVGAGLAGAWALTRLLSSMMSGVLYGVRAFDPLTIASVTALLSVMAVLACFIPAARASRVAPMVALRSE